MTKGDLRKMIQEVLKEELANGSILQEAVEGPGYAIKAWDTPEAKTSGTPVYDSTKEGTKYAEFDDVIKALSTSKLSELGAYEITWIKSGEADKN